MKTAILFALIFAGFAAAGSLDYQVTAGLADEHAPTLLAAQGGQP